ncbi:hypothetical protein THAOC_36576 [Thalassiosira oceanica]|uniref:Uncharacterized protein n=1 Tax=Thalassiosira oceanica TaxID=159749 RepID=K0R7X7_THAOC|nr:hypothetical protein THAOC_36576 [Thalassiosira oceanica]|eukprot:EJK44851.1 hypothetical protein THAOC_36576 [Thalassiosira oceanica]
MRKLGATPSRSELYGLSPRRVRAAWAADCQEVPPQARTAHKKVNLVVEKYTARFQTLVAHVLPLVDRNLLVARVAFALVAVVPDVADLEGFPPRVIHEADRSVVPVPVPPPLSPDPPRPVPLPGRGEDGRGVPRHHVEVVAVQVRQVDRSCDSDLAAGAVVALPRPVPRAVAHEYPRVGPVVYLAPAHLVLRLDDELGPRVLGGVDPDEEVERPAADVLPVRVQEASLAVGHGHEAEGVDVEGFESESFADALKDRVEASPCQGPQGVLVRQFVRGVEPVHVALPFLRGPLDIPREVAELRRIVSGLVWRVELVEPPSTSGLQRVLQ